MILGIDASNIRAGGGVVHLRELLSHAKPEKYGFDKVIVWAPSATLEQLPVKPWLKKFPQKLLDKSLPFRLFWQKFVLKRLAKKHCDLLFLPSGNTTSFHPNVSFCQNLLPFEPEETARFGWSLIRLRYWLLRKNQCKSFLNANGTMFLSDISVTAVEKMCGRIKNHIVIPHGVAEMFRYDKPAPIRKSGTLTINYVSIINVYKHQWKVAKAVVQLLEKGYDLKLQFEGPRYGPAYEKLQKVIFGYPEYSDRIIVKNRVPQSELPTLYRSSDIFVFASSCETFGLIVLEAMAAGVPIACSNMSSMKEILGDAGLYFDPLDSQSITDILEKYINKSGLREEMAAKALRSSGEYSWERCANETFGYLKEVYG